MEIIEVEKLPTDVHKQVQSRKKFLIPILILLVVLSGLFFMFWSNDSLKQIINSILPNSNKQAEVYNPSDNYFCNSIGDDSFLPDSTLKNKCYEALSKKEISICNGIPRILGRWSCYLAFANEFSDPSVCSRYFYGDNVKSCISQSVASLEDLDLCKNLSSSWQSGCYLRIAKMSKNSNICSEFTSALGERGTNICYFQVAEQKADIAVCNLMPTSKDNYYTKDGCLGIVAEKKLDQGICKTITNQKDKDGCFYGVATAIPDLSICNNISEEFSRDGCYMDVAVALKDPTICDNIKDNYQTDSRCYTPIASLTGDITSCANTSDPLSCQLTVAKTHPDVSICKAMPEGWYSEHCYLNVAVRLQDPSYCIAIKDPGGQSSCYGFLAMLKKDFELCNQVPLETFQNNCRVSVASIREECSVLDDQSLKNTCNNFLAADDKNWKAKNSEEKSPTAATSKIRMRTGMAHDQAYCGSVYTDNLYRGGDKTFVYPTHEVTNLDCFTSSLKSCLGTFLNTTGIPHSGFLSILGKESDSCIIQSHDEGNNLDLQCRISTEVIDKLMTSSTSTMASLLIALEHPEELRDGQGFSCQKL